MGEEGSGRNPDGVGEPGMCPEGVPGRNPEGAGCLVRGLRGWCLLAIVGIRGLVVWVRGGCEVGGCEGGGWETAGCEGGGGRGGACRFWSVCVCVCVH